MKVIHSESKDDIVIYESKLRGKIEIEHKNGFKLRITENEDGTFDINCETTVSIEPLASNCFIIGNRRNR